MGFFFFAEMCKQILLTSYGKLRLTKAAKTTKNSTLQFIDCYVTGI